MPARWPSKNSLVRPSPGFVQDSHAVALVRNPGICMNVLPSPTGDSNGGVYGPHLRNAVSGLATLSYYPYLPSSPRCGQISFPEAPCRSVPCPGAGCSSPCTSPRPPRPRLGIIPDRGSPPSVLLPHLLTVRTQRSGLRRRGGLLL